MFYINPFRTGPNDPTIKGTVTVTVYDPANPTIAKEETFGVNITSGPSLLYDVVIDDILVADRNIGHQSRMTGEDGKPFMVRNFYESDMVKIYSSGADLAENINSSYNDSGKRYDPGSDWNEGNGEKIYTTSENQISAVFSKLSNAAVDWWKNYHLDPEQTFSAFYKTDTKWNIPSTSQMEKIKIMSDFLNGEYSWFQI